MSIRTDTGPKSFPPLVDGLINDNLTEVWPDLNETLFQLIAIACTLLIDSVLKTLKTATSSVVDWSGLLDGQRSDVMNSGVIWRKYSTVSRERWAGALSCWKTNRSPASSADRRQHLLRQRNVSVMRTGNLDSSIYEDEFSATKFRSRYRYLDRLAERRPSEQQQ